jgi:YHS domain-containing protein
MLKTILVVLSFLPALAFAQKAEVYSDATAAIRGYDPVAYHRQLGPVQGSAQFTHQWRGATWHFASAANRDLFKASPEKYAPQYGGYCAFGVASGYAVAIDPEAWSVVEGKLYLNYSKSVQARWRSDVPGFIGKADANWPKVLAK